MLNARRAAINHPQVNFGSISYNYVTSNACTTSYSKLRLVMDGGPNSLYIDELDATFADTSYDRRQGKCNYARKWTNDTTFVQLAYTGGCDGVSAARPAPTRRLVPARPLPRLRVCASPRLSCPPRPAPATRMPASTSRPPSLRCGQLVSSSSTAPTLWAASPPPPALDRWCTWTLWEAAAA